MKKKKSIFYQSIGIIPMLFMALLLGACGDDAEGRIEIDDTAPAQVTNAAATSAAGAVVLTWNIPTSSSFMYTKVAYIDADGNEKYQMFSKERADESGKMTEVIKGFVKTDPVKFSLYACSVRGNNAGAVEVSGTPDEPNFTKLLDKISVEPALGGILINYANEYDETIIISTLWKSVSRPAMTGSLKFAVDPKSSGSKYVRLDVEDGFLQEESVITINTEDEFGHPSHSKDFKVTPKAVVRLDQSLMSIPGYNPDSNDGTIGYSSHETMGEGAVNGRLGCILDNNTSTFWHASWKVATKYPHWFIIDLGKDYTIANIELTRRIGNARGQLGETIYTCSDSSAPDKSNPEAWAWVNQGTYPFDPNTDSPQTVDLSNNLPVARFIKVYFGEEMVGASNFAMLSEFNVYIVE